MDQLWDEVRSKVDAVDPAASRAAANRQWWTPTSETSTTSSSHSAKSSPPDGRSIERPYSPRELELMADTLVDDLETLESVARVDRHGGPEREVIDLAIDPGAMGQGRPHHRHPPRSFVQSRNITAPGGEIIEDGSGLRGHAFR